MENKKIIKWLGRIGFVLLAILGFFDIEGTFSYGIINGIIIYTLFIVFIYFPLWFVSWGKWN